MYTITRTNLIIYAFSTPERTQQMISGIQEDIVMSGEFILTDEDLLQRLGAIPKFLLEEYKNTNSPLYDLVSSKYITINPN